MKTYIDCFIAWTDEQQGQATENALRAESQVANIYHLTESIGSSKTIRFIAETATAPYVLLYTKYDTLQLGYHALDRMLVLVSSPLWLSLLLSASILLSMVNPL